MFKNYKSKRTPQFMIIPMIDIIFFLLVFFCEQLTLIDCQRTVEFEIFSHLRHRYAPGVERNTEFWFCLALPHEREITFTEHLAYRRLVL